MSASEDKATTGTAREFADGIKKPLRDGIDTVRSHLDETAHVAQDAAHSALDKAREGLDQAREKAADAFATGKDKAVGAYATGREKASEAYQAAFDKAKAAGTSAGEGVETNPIAALAGGIALGVVIGALLPRTQREGKVYGAIGSQIGDLAKEATGAAKDAGVAKFADLGVSKDKGRELVKTVVDAAIAAAVAAGSAAFQSAKDKRGA